MTDWISIAALVVAAATAFGTGLTALVLWSQLQMVRAQRAEEAAKVRALEGAVERLTGVIAVLAQQLQALQARNQIAANALAVQMQQLEAKRDEAKWSKIGTVARVGIWLARHLFRENE